VLQALRATAGDCEHPHRPHGDSAEDAGRAGVAASGDPDDDAGTGQRTATCRASLAGALVEVAGAYLSGKIAAAGNPDIYQVIVHVGPESLQGGPADDDPALTPAAQHGVPAETSVRGRLSSAHGSGPGGAAPRIRGHM
jgi:hypothetical protein